MKKARGVLLLGLAACASDAGPRVRLLPEPRDPAGDLQVRIEAEHHVVRAGEPLVLRVAVTNVGLSTLAVPIIETVNLDTPFHYTTCFPSQACVDAYAVPHRLHKRSWARS